MFLDGDDDFYMVLYGDEMDIKDAIKKVVAGINLTEKETKEVFCSIMSGKASLAQIGAFITALRIKGETIDEITGAARVMREKAAKIKTKERPVNIVDTCGTGGTGTKVFNVSTASAFVLAGAGIKVAKHGNRGISSNCGSADVLEALGVKLDISISRVAKCIDKINIGFLFAPSFHGAMRYASGPRREIGIRTVFNLLGPLCNPAGVRRQVIGIYDRKLTGIIANVLKKLGTKHAYVVSSGSGPLDEVTITGKTRVSELKNGRIRTYYLEPKDFGVKRNTLKSIKGGTIKQNVGIIRDILSGKKGPKRDVVLMNVAMALIAAGKVKTLKHGMKTAAESIDSGRASDKLNELIKMTNK